MKSKTSKPQPLYTIHCSVFFNNSENGSFAFGNGPLLFARKVELYADKIIFGRSVLFDKPFTLKKSDIDGIEIFHSVASLGVRNVRIYHHAPGRSKAPITIDPRWLFALSPEPANDFIAILQDNDYPCVEV